MNRDKFEAHCVEQLIVARAAAQARGDNLTSARSLATRQAV